MDPIPAVREKLVDQEAEGLGKLYPGRHPTLGTANLSHEVTKNLTGDGRKVN
jgi:hypothetical protein